MMKGLITKDIIVLIKNNKMQFFCILMFAVLGIFPQGSMKQERYKRTGHISIS